MESTRAFQTPVHISVLTLGELRKGVALKRGRDPAGANQLAQWVDEIEAEYADRILSVDRVVARMWGELLASRPLPIVDTLIAATALAHRLTLVTRNICDFAATGVEVHNPWITD
jgi:predicted nucleic acid-binding protein